MLFGSDHMWWGDMGKRNTPHEGLDFHLYRTVDGNIKSLDEKTLVPALFSGIIANICPDFLGMSVFISHDNYHENDSRLFTIYGHINPADNIHPGLKVNEGDVIGTIADTAKTGSKAPPHLHLTLSWISDTVSPSRLDWQTITDSLKVKLLDPLDIIKCPYLIIENI